MLYRRIALAWAASFVALAAGCTSCTSREEMAAGEPDGGEAAPEGFPHAYLLEPPYKMIGEEADDNRYSSTVAVRPLTRLGRKPNRSCGGVLIAPKLVLTAAHCMCAPNRGETTRFDGSGCSAEAAVFTMIYEPWKDGERESRGTSPVGDVVIHPEFQISIDTRGAVATSRADLALVRLKHPVRDIRPVHLAADDAKAGEVLIVVGFGYFDADDDHEVGLDSTRRLFNREKVGMAADGERLIFGSMDLADYQGDTGGPCLRETKRGLELVGISQRGLGLTPAFTRIAPYRTWLEEQIRFAQGEGSTSSPTSPGERP